MAKLTVRDINTNGKRVFARVDYNVPLEEKDGRMVITDETRIQATLPTLRLLRSAIGDWTLTGLAPGAWRAETVHLPSPAPARSAAAPAPAAAPGGRGRRGPAVR